MLKCVMSCERIPQEFGGFAELIFQTVQAVERF